MNFVKKETSRRLKKLILEDERKTFGEVAAKTNRKWAHKHW